MLPTTKRVPWKHLLQHEPQTKKGTFLAARAANKERNNSQPPSQAITWYCEIANKGHTKTLKDPKRSTPSQQIAARSPTSEGHFSLKKTRLSDLPDILSAPLTNSSIVSRAARILGSFISEKKVADLTGDRFPEHRLDVIKKKVTLPARSTCRHESRGNPSGSTRTGPKTTQTDELHS